MRHVTLFIIYYDNRNQNVLKHSFYANHNT